LDDRPPRALDERTIAGGAKVVRMRDDVEWRRVGARPGVWKLIEPWDERRGLRDLVGNLSVLALVLAEELERVPRRLERALRVRGERGPERVASEEPREPRPLAFARRAKSGDEAGAEQGIDGDAFVDRRLRPSECVIEPRIGSLHLDRVAIELLVVIGRPVVERTNGADDPVVGRFGGGASVE